MLQVARDQPAPEAVVDAERSRARPAAWRRTPAPSIIGGDEFSGMSKNAVKPPAASAALPVSRPSQWVRPGSLKCTCGSRPPGSTCRPTGVELLATAARELGLDGGDRAVEHADVRGHRSGRRDHRPAAHDQVEHRPSTEARRRFDRQSDVVQGDRFVRVMADAARAADEQHRRVGHARHRHRVVPGAAREPPHLHAGRGHGVGDALDQRGGAGRRRPGARSATTSRRPRAARDRLRLAPAAARSPARARRRPGGGCRA